MMHIGLDLFEHATYQFRGIARYEQNLASSLVSLIGGESFSFLSPPSCGRDLLPDLESPSDLTFRTVRLTLKQRKALWMLSNLTHLPLDRLVGPVDLFHAPDFVGPWLANAPLVITVHDLAPWLYPETRTWPNLLFYRTAFPVSARRATRIITDSDSTRDGLCQRWPELEGKATTIHLAPGDEFRPQPRPDVFGPLESRLRLPNPYVLSVGTLEPRKNYPLLLDAFATLLQQNLEWTDVGLVIVGKKGWRCAGLLSKVHQLGLDERVIMTHSLTDDELCQLYVHCLAFVLPSLYEGFGLPVVEALTCGAPVITSTAAALVEVAGDAALTVDPYRTADLVAALRTLMVNPQKREDLRRRGLERARAFSWERTARETWQVYQEAMRVWRKGKA